MYRDTKTIRINWNTFCVYCGKKLSSTMDFEYGVGFSYYFCECEGAKLDIERQVIEEKLRVIEKLAYEEHIKRKLYENDLNKLLEKYEIPINNKQ